MKAPRGLGKTAAEYRELAKKHKELGIESPFARGGPSVRPAPTRVQKDVRNKRQREKKALKAEQARLGAESESEAE